MMANLQEFRTRNKLCLIDTRIEKFTHDTHTEMCWKEPYTHTSTHSQQQQEQLLFV
jgi:hypothetical protein